MMRTHNCSSLPIWVKSTLQVGVRKERRRIRFHYSASHSRPHLFSDRVEWINRTAKHVVDALRVPHAEVDCWFSANKGMHVLRRLRLVIRHLLSLAKASLVIEAFSSLVEHRHATLYVFGCQGSLTCFELPLKLLIVRRGS